MPFSKLFEQIKTQIQIQSQIQIQTQIQIQKQKNANEKCRSFCANMPFSKLFAVTSVAALDLHRYKYVVMLTLLQI